MYIKITKNAKGQAYYHLVESYRHNGKVKQRTLMSLGKVDDNRIQETIEVLQKFVDQVSAIDIAKDVDVKDAYILGPVLVLDKVMEQYSIYSILQHIAQQHPKLSYNFQKAVFSLILSRFVQPVSKLSLYDHWLDKFYPDKVDTNLDLHHIYRSLDILADEKESIENNLYHYSKDLFTLSVDVVLYDLTTLRFESTRTDLDTLRRFGYSKEKRNDCTQVVLGLLTDQEGIPLCFEVHPGNTFEGHTLKGIVNKMREKFQVRRFIFVADRGLFSEENIEELKKEGGEFIVGLRLGKKAHQIKDAYDIKQYKWVNERLAVYETTLKDERVILFWSAARAERDRKTREEILEKIRQKLSGKNVKAKDFITNENYKKYVHIQESKVELNEELIKEEAAKDGFFGIITNVKDATALEIIMHYKQLWHIEDAFGEIKGTLRARPVFHWTDKRIIGHLVVCFLSYFCEAVITKELRKKQEKLVTKSIEKKIVKPRSLTVPMALKELSSVLAIPVRIGKKRIWVRTDIRENAVKVMKALNMKIPPKILKIEEEVEK